MLLIDPKVITLMMKNGQPAKILFKTKQWRAADGYQDKQWQAGSWSSVGTQALCPRRRWERLATIRLGCGSASSRTTIAWVRGSSFASSR